MFLVCGRSIKQTMKIKDILRIPLTDRILEPANVASICCSSSNEGFSWCFQKSFWLLMSYCTKEHNLVEQLMIFDAKFEAYAKRERRQSGHLFRGREMQKTVK